MKVEKVSQKQMILNHLMKYGFINPKVALRKFGCMRLGARISDLRDEGWNIVTEPTEDYNMVTGNRVCYATYRLVEA